MAGFNVGSGMKINVVCAGRIKESYFAQAIAEYQKRLSRYAEVSLFEIDEITTPNNLEKEAKLLEPHLKGKVVIMDRLGKITSSAELAQLIEKSCQTGSQMTFVIGSSQGLSEQLKKRADEAISFGTLTLPHSLARVVLYEQIYRAFSINSNGKYHK